METTFSHPTIALRFLTYTRRAAPLAHVPKVSAAIILLSLVVAVFAPLIVPHDPIDINLRERERPPAIVADGRMEYVLGTDRLGRDILSRIIMGARISLSISAMAIICGGLLGTTLGILAGYWGGWVDILVMRTADATLAFPSILIALVFSITVGPGFWVVVAVLGFILWARYARLVRGEVLSIKEREYVALARVAGASTMRIIVIHILPNVVNSLVVLSTLQVGWAIVVEAALSFLGAGIPPPTPTWGGMIADGRRFVDTLWWISFFPGIAIMLVVLAFNSFGDWLRDVLDPKLSQL